jgi:hypothetical protein
LIINATSIVILRNFLEAEKTITNVKGRGFEGVELELAKLPLPVTDKMRRALILQTQYSASTGSV